MIAIKHLYATPDEWKNRFKGIHKLTEGQILIKEYFLYNHMFMKLLGISCFL